jgi:hypothetical protein
MYVPFLLVGILNFIGAIICVLIWKRIIKINSDYDTFINDFQYAFIVFTIFGTISIFTSLFLYLHHNDLQDNLDLQADLDLQDGLDPVTGIPRRLLNSHEQNLIDQLGSDSYIDHVLSQYQWQTQCFDSDGLP